MTAPVQGPGRGSGYASTPDSAPDVSERSLGDLMRQVSEDLATLVRQEIELAKAELRQEGSKAGRAAALFGAAGVGGYLVLLFLSLALWAGLSNVMDAGWAALIVAIIWAVLAAVLYAAAKGQARRVRGLKQTTDTVHRIPEALKPDREGVTR